MESLLPKDDPADALQFDRADLPAGGVSSAATCAQCSQAISSLYYELAGRTVCETCKQGIVEALHGGSKLARFFRAAVAGLLVAAVCSAGWWAVTKLTGYEIGLIAIIVGAAVGLAVRKGSAGRGGWVYQGLAILLSYLAITASYVPDVINEYSKAAGQSLRKLTESDKERVKIAVFKDGAVEMNQKACSPEDTFPEMERIAAIEGFVMYYREGRGEFEPPVSADVIGDKWTELGLPVAYYYDPAFQNLNLEAFHFQYATTKGKLTLIFLASILAVQIPFLSLPENIIGLLIIAFALWEAWKLNKRVAIPITGPHALATRSTAPVPSIERPGSFEGGVADASGREGNIVDRT
jgi:hypothetical protein